MRKQAMILAHAIRRQNQFLTWSQCQAQAWKVAKLQTALRGGVVVFTYQKQDGEVRRAEGTLSADLITYQAKGTGRPAPITVVKYFDLERKAFRSFRAERILSIAA